MYILHTYAVVVVQIHDIRISRYSIQKSPTHLNFQTCVDSPFSSSSSICQTRSESAAEMSLSTDINSRDQGQNPSQSSRNQH